MIDVAMRRRSPETTPLTVTRSPGRMDVLRRFGAPAWVLGEQWLTKQERKLDG
jgi:hypothetical protein